MHANITSLAYFASSIGDITSINIELGNLKKWLYRHKLILNVAETTSMIIGINRKLHPNEDGKLDQ